MCKRGYRFTNVVPAQVLPLIKMSAYIRQSVDSLCRDGAGRAIYEILKQKPYNFTTNMLKAYLTTQPSSFRASMINNTNTLSQKPCGRQLNTKVYGSKKAIFLVLSSTNISREWLKYSPWL